MRRLRLVTNAPFVILVRVALLASLVFGAVVVAEYGGESFFPGLVAGFAGSLVAFMLALRWEREREVRGTERDAKDLEQRRATEVRRRFEPVAAELEKNAESLEFLKGVFQAATDGTAEAAGLFTIANPQLLEGAWNANAPRLSELVARLRA